jgi:hypothetical protein
MPEIILKLQLESASENSRLPLGSNMLCMKTAGFLLIASLFVVGLVKNA